MIATIFRCVSETTPVLNTTSNMAPCVALGITLSIVAAGFIILHLFDFNKEV